MILKMYITAYTMTSTADLVKIGTEIFVTNNRNVESQSSDACAICESRTKPGTTEIYVISDNGDKYYFSVNKAKEIVTDGREPFPIADKTVRKIVSVNSYEATHLPHVDPDKSGILAQRFGGLILLDGVHRAVRCLNERKTFYAYLLAYEESLKCIVREEIRSENPKVIAQKIRAVLKSEPEAGQIEADIECSQDILEKALALLTPQERNRLIPRAVPKRSS